MEIVDEIITEVKVETDSVTVKDLKENIKLLKAEMEAATVGTEDFKKKQEQLEEAQRTLKQVLQGSTASLEEMKQASKGASESYDSLVNRMADLRKEWRATTDQTKRADLGKQIKNINDQLKNMDASRGVFSRNVGDYANQLAKGFQAVGGAASSVINPIQGVTNGLTAMSSTPIIAVIGVIINLLAKLMNAFKSNEETMNAFQRAMAPVNALGTVFIRWVQSAADSLVKMIDWLVKAGAAVGKFLHLIDDDMEAEMEVHKKLVEDEQALVKKQRDTELENARSAEIVSEMKAKAAEKDKYTAKERLEFLQKAVDEEKKIADRNLQLAQDDFDLQKRKAELAGNSAEENEALNRAEIKLIQTRTDHNNKLKELNAQMAEATNAIKQQRKEYIRLDEVIKGISDDIDKLDISFDMDIDDDGIDLSKYEDKWKEIAAYRINAIEHAADNERKLNRARITDERALADEEYRITVETQQRKMEVLKEAYSKTTDPLAALELHQQIADMEVDIEATKFEREKELMERNKKDREQYAKTALSIAGGMADMLSAVADSMTVTNKKEFEQQKKLQIASATINMLSGVANAVSSAMSMGAILGPIMGAINAATVIATGIAQINKIKAQTYDGGSASVSAPNTSSAVVNAPQVETSMPMVRTVTSASEEDRLNRMASPVRAYIVDSDLQAKEAERDRVDNETTF